MDQYNTRRKLCKRHYLIELRVYNIILQDFCATGNAFQILALSSAGLGNARPAGYISRILDNYFAAENMYKIEKVSHIS